MAAKAQLLYSLSQKASSLLPELSVQTAAWVRSGSLTAAKVTFLVHKKCRLSSGRCGSFCPEKGTLLHQSVGTCVNSAFLSSLQVPTPPSHDGLPGDRVPGRAREVCAVQELHAWAGALQGKWPLKNQESPGTKDFTVQGGFFANFC